MKLNGIFFGLIMIIILGGCETKNKPVNGIDYFPLYIGKEINDNKREVMMTVPVIDKLIPIRNQLRIENKIKVLSDSISMNYFHGLKIKLLKLDSTDNKLVLHLELIEKDKYKGPGSLPMYESWYDYFQGSSGGLNTTIILRENFLQRYYEGDWIDAIIFYYQGSEMDEWDHIFLNGEINRFE